MSLLSLPVCIIQPKSRPLFRIPKENKLFAKSIFTCVGTVRILQDSEFIVKAALVLPIQYYPSIFHVFSTYFPRIFHVFSTYFPRIFPVLPLYYPSIIPALSLYCRCITMESFNLLCYYVLETFLEQYHD